MTNPVSRPRWSDPHAEVVPLPRSTAEQELAALKRQHQDLQARHAQLAATLAQLSKQYGATQPLPSAAPLTPPEPITPSLTPVIPLPSQPEARSEQRSDLSFLSELRQRQAPQAAPQPKQTIQPQVVQPVPYPVQPLQPPQPLPPAQALPAKPAAPQWQEAPQAWSDNRQNQPQSPAGYAPSPQPPAWGAAPTWGQPDTYADNYDQQPQYDSLYEKVRHQQDDQSTPMWMWLVAAIVLLTISFGTGFLMVRHFIGRSAPPPPVENVN